MRVKGIHLGRLMRREKSVAKPHWNINDMQKEDRERRCRQEIYRATILEKIGFLVYQGQRQGHKNYIDNR